MKTTLVLYFGIFLSVLANANSSAIPKQPLTERSLNVTEEVTEPTICYIRVNGDLGGPVPIFTDKGTLSLLQPNITGVVVLTPGESFDMHCTSSFFAPFQKYNRLTATCVDKHQFTVNGAEYHLDDFSCMDWPSFEARRTGQECGVGSELVEIGFPLAAGFLRTYSVCYESKLGVPHYAIHELMPNNVYYQYYLPDQRLLSGDFYDGKDIDNLYVVAQQNESLSALLDLDASLPYVHDKRGYRLIASQLAGRQNFIFNAAQRTAYFYINTAPQWESVFYGNWRYIELAMRDFIADNNLNAKIYAGAWSISTLPDADGQQRQLFLDAETHQLPVPKIFYRIIIDQATRKGIVLVAVNNPYATLREILQNYVVCKDVGEQLNWIEWHKTRLSDGYGYACAVDDFLKTVKDLPHDDLQTSGLLGVDESSTIPTSTVSQ